MGLDMGSKVYSKRLTGFEHLFTIVFDDGSIKNCSRCRHISQLLSNENILQERLGGTGKETTTGRGHIPTFNFYVFLCVSRAKR